MADAVDAAGSCGAPSQAQPTQATAELLHAVRSLSDQIGAIQLEQTALKDQLKHIGEGTTDTPAHSTDQTNSKAPAQGAAQQSGNSLCSVYKYVDLTTPLPKTDTPGEENKDKKLTIESFDHWLEASSVRDPAKYTELAQCRGIIQKANRKFRWKTVYDFDVQFRMSLPGTAGRLDHIDSTLYTTILDSSAVHKEGISCQRCKSEHHLVCDCSFRAKLTVEETKAPTKAGSAADQWKYAKWFHNNIEGCNLFQRRACQQGISVSAPMSAKLVGGATQWPIVNSLPVLDSPFHPTTWRNSLRDFYDPAFIDDLITDIEHGVRIGYTGPRIPHISPNHFSALGNSGNIALELERELGLRRKIGPFLTPPFENFVGSPMGAIPKKR